MPSATYVSGSFQKNLSHEFPHLHLRWSEVRCRWGLYERDDNGSEWFECWIEGPNGEHREPGDWLLARLRPFKKENQGIHCDADKRAWIRKLHEGEGYVCTTCSFETEDSRDAEIFYDFSRGRWCRACIEKAGWKPGQQPNHMNLKTGAIVKKSALGSRGRIQEKLRDHVRYFAKQGRVFSKTGATSTLDYMYKKKPR